MSPARRQLSWYGWRPADPPRRPVLFVNPGSGGGKAADAGVAGRARERDIEVVLLGDGLVAAPSEPVFDHLQLGPHPFGVGLAPDPEPPAPGGRADVRDPMNANVSGLPSPRAARLWAA
jgi:hypothetical protein